MRDLPRIVVIKGRGILIRMLLWLSSETVLPPKHLLLWGRGRGHTRYLSCKRLSFSLSTLSSRCRCLRGLEGPPCSQQRSCPICSILGALGYFA